MAETIISWLHELLVMNTRGAAVSFVNFESVLRDRAKRILPWLWGCGIFLNLVFLASAVYVGRGLFADGANFFVGLLGGGIGWPVWDDSKHIRLFVNVLNQFPVSAAVRAGFDDIALLRLLFGAGLFLTPASLMAYCFWVSFRAKDYRVFVAAVASWVLFVLPSSIFSLNQAITTVALCWILIHYALLRVEIRFIDWVVVGAILVVLFRSHEGMILWGLVIAAAATMSVRRDGARVFNKLTIIRYFLALFGVFHAVFVWCWQQTHPVAKETESFLGLLSYISPSEMWIGNARITVFVLVGIAGALLMRGAAVYCRGAARSAGIILFGCVSCLAAILLISYVISAYMGGNSADPIREYLYRFLIPFGTPCVMAAIVLVYRLSPSPNQDGWLMFSIIVAIGLSAASLWQISSNARWAEFTNLSISVAENSGKAVVSPEEVRQYLSGKGKLHLAGYGVGWTWPVLGLSLQRSRFVHWMIRPDGFDEYFVLPSESDPYPTVPFLKLYPSGVFIFDDFLRLQRDAR